MKPCRPPRVPERSAPAGTDGQGERTAGRQVAPEPTCAGKEVGAACWMEIEIQPGCHVWNAYLWRDETVTWTGGCVGGLANGAGERTRNYTRDNGKATSHTETGELRNGKANGHWTLRFPTEEGLKDGVYEGLYVEDKRNGRWTWRWADGTVEEICYDNGDLVACP